MEGDDIPSLPGKFGSDSWPLPGEALPLLRDSWALPGEALPLLRDSWLPPSLGAGAGAGVVFLEELSLDFDDEPSVGFEEELDESFVLEELLELEELEELLELEELFFLGFFLPFVRLWVRLEASLGSSTPLALGATERPIAKSNRQSTRMFTSKLGH